MNKLQNLSTRAPMAAMVEQLSRFLVDYLFILTNLILTNQQADEFYLFATSERWKLMPYIHFCIKSHFNTAATFQDE